jgi:hypothetical protein
LWAVKSVADLRRAVGQNLPNDIQAVTINRSDGQIGMAFVQDTMAATSAAERKMTVMHEMAHALDYTVLGRASESDEFMKAYRADLAFAMSLTKQNNAEINAGIMNYAHFYADSKEAFAEAAARIVSPPMNPDESSVFQTLFKNSLQSTWSILTSSGLLPAPGL